MEIILNDKKETVNDNCSVAQLIEKLYGNNVQSMAVAINSQLVKKEFWKETLINPNDEIIVINAAYGG